MSKLTIITGGNAGIGKATAIGLARKGHHVVITSRSKEKAEPAVEEIKKESGSDKVEYVFLTLNSLKKVRESAGEIKSRFPKIDVLINNAGTYYSDLELSEDGIEQTLATNHVGHFLLTSLLIDNLKAAGSARVINLASMAHKSAKSLDLTDINYENGGFSGWGSYARSKVCNILFTRELGKRFEGTGINAYSIHPGGVRTEIAEKNSGFFSKWGWRLMKPFMITVEDGAATSIYLASSDEVKDVTGHYYHKCKQVHGSSLSRDMELAHALWEKSEELIGEKLNTPT